ncbi:MAG: bifunctional phosphoribosylaminoimidazolecarboxamide formyltransferase/IMP cyclohydrolase [Myxococcales bacterium]|nr:MAG: bifunctional phosphoribosylaminoimidazolecarboxamide formyltransferase/IMP cyclohydrolase [Myxococcales bacterium]
MSQPAAARQGSEPGEGSDVATRVERALISVSDKTGIVEFARGLVEQGVQILSTGGTAGALREAGLDVVDVSEHTGSPEILDGRVKTLHPRVHGGILARRDDASHRQEVAANGISYIDLVCVNLYPFAEVTSRGCSFEEAIENIDIGGPSMVRSAAKNHADVAIVVDPDDYDAVLAEIRADGAVSERTRWRLAVKAYRATAAYDGMIADWLGKQSDTDDEDANEKRFGDTIHQQWHKVQDLRYGENPHQHAAVYRAAMVEGPSIAAAKVIQGKELSYNNIVDADAALQLVMEFDETVCVAIKHTNPCGAALADSPLEAFVKARSCDPVSIFGGIVAFNRAVDGATAEQMKDVFLEIVLAPAFTREALEIYQSTPKLRNVRLLEVDPRVAGGREAADMKRVLGGLLVQTRDLEGSAAAALSVVSRRKPDAAELRTLDFAWRVSKHVKSNAIVLASGDRIVGVGAGQMSRVDSARIAVARAREHGLETKGSVVASDAFFPFRDGLDVCAEAGAVAAIQPGGSLRDDEIIAAADEHGMAMVMTGIRHFRH